MKIEKLPSGSYRIRKMYNGTMYTVVTEYKPTQKEAIQLLAAELDKIQTSKEQMTFKTAAEKYIEVKANILSPSTIRSYCGITRNLSSSFTGKRISDITAIDVQKEINDYSRTRSPKTTHNAHGFISAVMSMFAPNIMLNTTLPQKSKSDFYIPTDEDVKRILTAAKGTEYEIPLLLATLGLRRSEICALTLDDLDGNTLTINKALVLNEEDKFVLKYNAKTEEGNRKIYIPDAVADLIREQGYIYKRHPGKISEHLEAIQKNLGIPKFSMHKLRHYYASMSHALGIPDSYIMQAGGWKSDSVLKGVYRHAMEDKKKEMQEFAAEYITELIEN